MSDYLVVFLSALMGAVIGTAVVIGAMWLFEYLRKEK